MEKKIYMTPLMEVETISLSRCLLDGSPTHPIPPLGPGLAPARWKEPVHRTPVF
jgi:hypothetical protein